MIQKITNLNLRPKTLNRSENKQQYNNAGISHNLKSGYDSFERSTAPAFTGKANIKNYENVLSSLDANLNRVKNSLSKYAAENLPGKKWQRVSLAIASLGISEGVARISANNRINKETGQILESMRTNQDTQSNIINSDISDTNYSTDWAIEKIELEAQHALAMDDIKRKQIVPLFIAPIFNKTEVPNCLMISCGSEDTNKELIEWTKAESPCEIVTLNYDDDIVEALEKAEEHYQQTGERTLMHIENFDTLINPKTSDEETIGAMKGIMGSCSDFYHTTILFSSQHPDELDKIAMGPHRVERVEGSLSTMEEQLREIACSQLVENHIGTKSLYEAAGLYNEIPPVGKDLSPEDVSKMKARFAEVLPGFFKSQIVNFNKPHTKTTTPATFYVKALDGSAKEYHGYKHTIKFDIEQKGIKSEQSYFSLKEDFDIPVYAAWYRMFSDTHQLAEATAFADKHRGPERLPKHDDNQIKIGNNDNLTTNIFLNIADEVYYENKEKYKTGIPEIDNRTNINISPFSFRTMLHPVEYRHVKTKQYNPREYYKYNNEDLKSPWPSYINLDYSDINYKLDINKLPLDRNLFEIAVRDKLVLPAPYTNDKNLIFTAEHLRELEMDKRGIHIITATSKEEADRKFILEELKDKVWCIKHPESALVKLLHASGLDKQGVRLRPNPDNDEMSRVMRIIRDNMIELTKKDMKKIDYIDIYCKSAVKPERKLNRTLFGDIPALILIANEHLIDRKEAANPNKYFDLRAYANIRYCYPAYEVRLSQEALEDTAARLEHYDYLKVASDVLKCISGKDTWYYEYGGLFDNLGNSMVLFWES